MFPFYFFHNAKKKTIIQPQSYSLHNSPYNSIFVAYHIKRIENCQTIFYEIFSFADMYTELTCSSALYKAIDPSVLFHRQPDFYPVSQINNIRKFFRLRICCFCFYLIYCMSNFLFRSHS